MEVHLERKLARAVLVGIRKLLEAGFTTVAVAVAVVTAMEGLTV